MIASSIHCKRPTVHYPVFCCKVIVTIAVNQLHIRPGQRKCPGIFYIDFLSLCRHANRTHGHIRICAYINQCSLIRSNLRAVLSCELYTGTLNLKYRRSASVQRHRPVNRHHIRLRLRPLILDHPRTFILIRCADRQAIFVCSLHHRLIEVFHQRFQLCGVEQRLVFLGEGIVCVADVLRFHIDVILLLGEVRILHLLAVCHLLEFLDGRQGINAVLKCLKLFTQGLCFGLGFRLGLRFRLRLGFCLCHRLSLRFCLAFGLRRFGLRLRLTFGLRCFCLTFCLLLCLRCFRLTLCLRSLGLKFRLRLRLWGLGL